MSNKNSKVKIIEVEKFKLFNPLVIAGFSGVGLIGGIAISHIIDKLKMKEIGHIRSKYLPPTVVFFDGKLRHPFRIYSQENGKLCAIVCEVPLRSTIAHDIAEAILDWVEKKGAKELVVLGGVAVRSTPKKRKVYCAT